MEKSESVDQSAAPAVALIHAHPQLFARQGAVVATHRKVGQRTYGPYYRLAYRVEGQQRSVYIGRDPQQAEAVLSGILRSLIIRVFPVLTPDGMRSSDRDLRPAANRLFQHG